MCLSPSIVVHFGLVSMIICCVFFLFEQHANEVIVLRLNMCVCELCVYSLWVVVVVIEQVGMSSGMFVCLWGTKGGEVWERG